MSKVRDDAFDESEIIIDLYIRRMIDDDMSIDDAIKGAMSNPIVSTFWNEDDLSTIFSREIQDSHQGVKH
jgi:hypothetical protein